MNGPLPAARTIERRVISSTDNPSTLPNAMHASEGPGKPDGSGGRGPGGPGGPEGSSGPGAKPPKRNSYMTWAALIASAALIWVVLTQSSVPG